jgi:hypothetical protein
MTARCLLPVAITLVLAACGGTEATGGIPLSADPRHYLLSIDQLITADFTVSTPAHAIDAATLAGGDTRVASLLTTSGFGAAAGVEFFRTADLATANGPLDIVNTAARFSSAAGAAAVFSDDARRLDATSGSVPVSAGALGDQAHAVSVLRAAPNNVQAVQITLEWRVANVINLLILRGRYGGTRLDDALTLAQRILPAEKTSSS